MARAIVGGTGPVFLAAAPTGEEKVALEAFRLAKQSLPDARLILAPRHPSGPGRSWLCIRYGQGRHFIQVESGSEEGGRWEILVIDRIGVLFDLYGVCDAAFIGGSLVDKGGQNIMEPAAFGLPFCHGPFMRDFAQAAKELGERGAASQVQNAEEMSIHWIDSLNPPERQKVRAASEEYFGHTAGAARKTVDEILSIIAKG